jgi:hypothetical protein
LLTDEVKAWIGKEATYTAPEELGRASIRYFALAVGHEPTDADVAPPTMICETAQYLEGGHGRGGHRWDLPVEGLSAIRGGNNYEFFRRVTYTDVITARWRLEDISEKLTSSGKKMLIVTSSISYENQKGELLATNRETLIYL